VFFAGSSAPIEEVHDMALPTSAKAMTFIVTRDRERAKDFYGGLLGFKLLNEDAFAAVFDLNGTMLRVSTVENHVAQVHTVLGWEVADIVETVGALRDLRTPLIFKSDRKRL
jgi:catechol 2,3-dioxygenase-like lactoylglutathione lyase family enzyme